MPALPPLGRDIDRCITKTSQKSKMAKMLYVINVMLHENASVKKIKNEQIIFVYLIKLDSLNGKIYLHYSMLPSFRTGPVFVQKELYLIIFVGYLNLRQSKNSKSKRNISANCQFCQAF